MIRLLAPWAVIAALTIALIAQGRAPGAAASTQTILPPCPQTRYAADGNMSPLFCVIDNPKALSYFASTAKRTFALGPDASPPEVVDALVADYKHGGTGPTLCSIYQLAAWRNHWKFGISIAAEVGTRLNMPPYWCNEPSFSGIE